MPVSAEVGGPSEIEQSFKQSGYPESKPVGDKIPNGIDVSQFRLTNEGLQMYGQPIAPNPDQLEQFQALKKTVQSGEWPVFWEKHDISFDLIHRDGKTQRIVKFKEPRPVTIHPDMAPTAKINLIDLDSNGPGQTRQVEYQDINPNVRPPVNPEPLPFQNDESPILQSRGNKGGEVYSDEAENGFSGTQGDDGSISVDQPNSGPDPFIDRPNAADEPQPFIERPVREPQPDIDPGRAEAEEASEDAAETGDTSAANSETGGNSGEPEASEGGGATSDERDGSDTKGEAGAETGADGKDSKGESESNPDKDAKAESGDPGTDEETRKKAEEVKARLASLRESIEAKLGEDKKGMGAWLGKKMGGMPVFRERAGFYLSVATAASGVLGLGDVGSYLKYGRRVLGMVNYGNVSSKMLMGREFANEVPAAFQRSEAILAELETKPEAAKAAELQEEFQKLIAYQIGLHQHGVDLARYATEAPKAPPPVMSFWRRTANAVGNAVKESVTTTEGRKRTGKMLLYSSPLIAAGLVTGGILPVLAAKAAYAGVSAFSSMEAYKRMKGVEKTEATPRSPLADKTAELIEKYQALHGLTKPEESDVAATAKMTEIEALRDKLLGAADKKQSELKWNNVRGKAFKRSLYGAGAAFAFFALTDFFHPAHAQAAGSEQHRSSPGGISNEKMPSGGETGNQTQFANATTGEIKGITSEPMSGPEAAHHMTPDEALKEAFKQEPSPDTPQKFGSVYSQGGKEWINLDIDHSGHVNAPEKFQVITEGGHKYALVTVADVRGHDGVPEIMTDHAVKVELVNTSVKGADELMHDKLSIEEQYGVLVDKNHPDQYVVSLDANEQAKYGPKNMAQAFMFGNKRSIVENILYKDNPSGWEQEKTAYGSKLDETMNRSDWKYTVGRSGAMASVDNNLSPEIQVDWDHKTNQLIGHGNNLDFLFNPTDRPLDKEEILASTGGDKGLAAAIYRSGLTFPEGQLQVEAVKFAGPNPADTESALNSMKTFSHELTTRIDLAFGDPTRKAELLQKIQSSVHDNWVDRDVLFKLLAMPEKAITADQAKTGTLLDITGLEKYATANISAFNSSPWRIPFELLNQTVKRLGSAITSAWQVDKGDNIVISVILNDHDVKQFVLPKVESA